MLTSLISVWSLATQTIPQRGLFFNPFRDFATALGGELLEVHHLTVLCYHLQHPSLYSQAGLAEAKNLLVEFLEKGSSPAEVRSHNRDRVDSRRRTWKIKATPGSHGVYTHPVRWRVTAANVIAAGPNRYPDTVRSWARAVLEDLKSNAEIAEFSEK
jgi:hypothetical protein